MSKWSSIRRKLLDDPKVQEEYQKLPSVHIAVQIINARKSKGLTQADLAGLAGTSQSAIIPSWVRRESSTARARPTGE